MSDSATRADQEPQHTIRHRARDLSLRLATLASATHDSATLLRHAAQAVLQATAATAVTFFRVVPEDEVSRERLLSARRLACAGEAHARRAGEPRARGHQMRAAAWWALHTGETVCWAPRPAARDERYETGGIRRGRAGLLAVPLGSDGRHTVLVAAAGAQAFDTARGILNEAHGALAALARTAQLAAALDQADRRQAQLQAIFSNSSEAIVTVDRDFHIIEANPAFSALIESEPPAFLGKHCAEVFACSNDRGQVWCHTSACPLAQAFAQAHTAPYREVYWRASSGKRREVSASFSPVSAPDGPRGVIIARDMAPVTAANRMRANFISMVSHELRTPLNTINGFLDIVLEGNVGKLNPRQEEFLTYAMESTKRMAALVEDILFISRADTGKFRLRLDTVAVPDMIEQSVRGVHAAARQAQVDIRVETPVDLPTIYADELRLQQVLSNLINNAVKFTPPRGVITIRASVERDLLRIDVHDTGDGVPFDEQSRIFERFYRREGEEESQPGGYGLGLAIARLIVQQHGGRIWVTNAPKGGAIFSFTVPLTLRPTPPDEEDA